MAVFLKCLEFFDKSGEIIVYKMPEKEGVMLETGSQLIVQENQVAILYKNGKALDKFSAGKYTLTTANIPIIGGMLNLPFKGKTPFSAYVYFISLKTFYNMGWGTPNPIPFRDSFFRLINLRANGAFSIKIADPEIFLETIVGTKGVESTYNVELFLKKILIEKLTQSLGSKMTTVLDVNMKYSEISDDTKNLVKEVFLKYGIELVDFIIESITPPEEVQRKINEASGIQAFDAEQYRSIGLVDAMKEAAKNSGNAGDVMGASMGIGAGIGMGKMMSDQFQQIPNNGICKNIQCAKKINSEWNVCPFCGTSQR